MLHKGAGKLKYKFDLSRDDRIVVFDGNPRLLGTTAEIEIHDCTSTTLMGSIVTREIQHGTGLLLPILF